MGKRVLEDKSCPENSLKDVFGGEGFFERERAEVVVVEFLG